MKSRKLFWFQLALICLVLLDLPVQPVAASPDDITIYEGEATGQKTRQWWYNKSAVFWTIGTMWNWAGQSKDGKFEVNDWGVSQGGSGIKYGGRQQNIVYEGNWAANYSIYCENEAGYITSLSNIRALPSYLGGPTTGNLTFWWYLNKLDAKEGYACIHLQIEKFWQYTMLDGTWMISPIVNMQIIMGQGSGVSFTNTTTDMFIRATEGFNTTGQWNRCSVNLWQICYDYKAEYAVWLNLVCPGVRVTSTDTGHVEILLDDMRVTTCTRIGNGSPALGQFYVEDGENATFWYQLQSPDEFVDDASCQHWAISWPKSHSLLNVTLLNITEVTRQVSASTDDCMVYDGTWSTLSPYIYMMIHYGGKYHHECGMRWLNIPIYQAGAILESKLYVKAEIFCAGSSQTNRLRGLDEGNAATFSSSGNFLGRARTDAYLDWAPSPMTMNEWYWSPSVKQLIQEVINRSDWAKGNALGIATYRDGISDVEMTFWSWNSGGANAPKIWIRYRDRITQTFSNTLSYNATHMEGRMEVEENGPSAWGPHLIYTTSYNILYDIVLKQGGVEDPLQLGPDDIEVSIRARMGSSGNFLQGAIASLQLYDESNTTIEYQNSGSTDVNGWWNHTISEMEAGKYFIRATATYGSVNNVGIKIGSMEVTDYIASDYVLDYPSEVLKVFLQTSLGLPAGAGAKVIFLDLESITDADGWVSFDLSNVPNFDYGSLAYPKGRMDNGIAVALAKEEMIVELEPSLQLISKSWDPNTQELNVEVSGEGTKWIAARSVLKPYYVGIGGVVYIEGSVWLWQDHKVNVSCEFSQQSISFSWTPFSSSAAAGSEESEDVRPLDERAKELVQEIFDPGVLQISDYWLGLILLGLILLALASASYYEENSLLYFLIAVLGFYIFNLLVVWYIIPAGSYPSDLTALANLWWRPPSIGVYGARQPAFLIVDFLSILSLVAVYGLTAFMLYLRSEK